LPDIPHPPIRRLLFRYLPRICRFVPCDESDPRGTLWITVDAVGRTVHQDDAGQWVVSGESGVDAEMVRDFIDVQARARRRASLERKGDML